MRKVIQEIDKEIRRLEVELEQAREGLDRADANDTHGFLQLSQLITKLVASIDALERFKRRLE